ncbi:MAG: alpha-L-fucosidase [Lachnospiraceae bacterium]
MKKLDERLIQIVPSPRQVAWQEMEFYAFIHFNINTFTDKEWGDGTEPESAFDPTDLDVHQWVNVVKSAGMTGIILTCKHHDGFCLWPSKYTKHTIANSPYKNGKGDLAKDLSEACQMAGLKFGVYLSPWDRNQSSYGMGKEYNDFFVNQLTELLTQYGPIFSVWFDGACGEGANGKRQVYDWERYYDTVRRLQPQACISVSGPDVRWCGNEAGDTRESEWSVVPKRTSETEIIAQNSQHEDNTKFRQRKILACDKDLGSREILQDEKDLIWYPAEVNTSIRPGWFYHAREDNQVRPLKELVDIYYHSVGGNATFLLNLPPDRRGRIHEKDAERLQELGTYIKHAFQVNLLETEGYLSASSELEGHSIEQVRRESYENWYEAPVGESEIKITICFDSVKKIRHLVMKENIYCSQRIERFTVELANGTVLSAGTVVGHKKIVPLAGVETDQLVIHIQDFRVAPTLAFIGIYE